MENQNPLTPDSEQQPVYGQAPYEQQPVQNQTSYPQQPTYDPMTYGQQQPVYAQPTYGQVVPKKWNVCAILSLVFGILGFLLPFVGFLSAIAGVVLGILGLVQIKKNPTLSGRGLAIAGIICGGVALLLALVLWIIALQAARLVSSAGHHASNELFREFFK